MHSPQVSNSSDFSSYLYTGIPNDDLGSTMNTVSETYVPLPTTPPEGFSQLYDAYEDVPDLDLKDFPNDFLLSPALPTIWEITEEAMEIDDLEKSTNDKHSIMSEHFECEICSQLFAGIERQVTEQAKLLENLHNNMNKFNAVTQEIASVLHSISELSEEFDSMKEDSHKNLFKLFKFMVSNFVLKEEKQKETEQEDKEEKRQK